MGIGLEGRFERYGEAMVIAMGHADRVAPTRWYLQGLMLPGGRKSVEPMAARVRPQDVRATHQSMHHLVSTSAWNDDALLAAVAEQVLPVLTHGGTTPCFWIIDDTGFPKKGRHSVGVARQYCGQTGKTDNCRVAVSLSLATDSNSLPLAYQLYLPAEWTDDPQRCAAVGVPASVGFLTKNQIAVAQIRAAVAAGVPRGVVLGDAAYGDDSTLRDALSTQDLIYALGVRPLTAVWWGKHQPATPPPPATGGGRPRVRVCRDAAHRPISVRALAQALPARAYRTITWRQGSAEPLSGRFARVRVVAAHDDRDRAPEWLVIEWPGGDAEPLRYWLSTLPKATTFKALVGTIKGRWRIERDYLELKQELGLGHYEGRNWRGFHHHASLCIAAYGFLTLERLRGSKKNRARFKAPAVPEGFRPRGAGADAAPSTALDRDRTLSSRPPDRTTVGAMSLLRHGASEHQTSLVTQ
ncbi:IS701 family transposase [Rhodanobacter denitrificans]|uniref:Transposase family protein n=3 Tax=Rhodanobacter TaxID=75309 RepID=M4NF97_9GAMM|nr:transposase family protein [Rhodanobacter denitrificans]AGG90276.1 transposase family protein [Rhodanobacter denitrificans]KZC21755.1 DDE endonuclease [Rhodanobacter denitrificans]